MEGGAVIEREARLVLEQRDELILREAEAAAVEPDEE